MNNSNIDVYDYCDKMMKDLSQFDKSLENGQSGKKFEDSFRYSSQNKQNTDQILNGYLNDADDLQKSKKEVDKQVEFAQQTK